MSASYFGHPNGESKPDQPSSISPTASSRRSPSGEAHLAMGRIASPCTYTEGQARIIQEAIDQVAAPLEVEIVRLNREVTNLDGEADDLMRENERLKVEVTDLKAQIAEADAILSPIHGDATYAIQVGDERGSAHWRVALDRLASEAFNARVVLNGWVAVAVPPDPDPS